MAVLEYHVIASPGPDGDAEAIYAQSHAAMRDGVLAKSGGLLVESGIAPVDFSLPGGVLAPKGSWFIGLERDTGATLEPVAKSSDDAQRTRELAARFAVDYGWTRGASARRPVEVAPPGHMPDPMRPASGLLAKVASAAGLSEAERQACAAITRGL
jgi:hypothetical protein